MAKLNGEVETIDETLAAERLPAKRRTVRREPIAEVEGVRRIEIAAPEMHTAEFTITGVAPYVQCRFSEKAKQEMLAKQIAGSGQRAKGSARKGRVLDEEYEAAMQKSTDGWIGIPAAALRNAMISACRKTGVKMTIAKISVFVMPDGYDSVDGLPLVRIYGEPRRTEMHVRLETGVASISVRPMWAPGWTAKPRIRWDARQFGAQDIANLLLNAGMFVGIGCGRPDSRKSAGLGWGLFDVASNEEAGNVSE